MALFGAWTFFLLVSCITFFLVLRRRRKPKDSNLPPGPIRLPWLGNLLQVDIMNLFTSLYRLQEQYRPVFTVYMGPEPVVVLCGYGAIKEALVDNAEAFGGRARLLGMDDTMQNYGIGSSNGERWRELRHFCQSALRNFGVGKRSMEERIQEEAEFLVEALRKTEGRSFDPTLCLSHAVSNIICSIVFGHRFEYEDKDFITLLGLLSESVRLMFSPWAQLRNFFPGLMRILPGPHQKLSRYLTDFKRFIVERVQLHRQSLDLNCPRDFIDCFLNKMEQEKNNPSSEYHDKNLIVCIFDLFSAGSASASTTLKYGLLLLLRYPEIEAKIHKEIDLVIGRNRRPCMDDRKKMPYTDAVIHEIHRFADVSPIGIPHLVTRDTQFRGYTIPKGTTVFPFLTTALQDPCHFETPMKFNPAHFLDENGDFRKDEAFLPFSAGKRVCPGENLARMELFLFLTTVLQNFNLRTLQDREEIDISPEVHSSGKLPRPYQLSVVPR
ncbi:cytochrome P450 2G1-like [Sceloporus undulatus]|uniref:cytochrome P450 2G1-like n=1 Tax=Sceloporus undulatus TaxID=8520 RepID=UPI001C4C22D4|nr:cytochrome P450 2G1-like [Sceloporus undulatus]